MNKLLPILIAGAWLASSCSLAPTPSPSIEIQLAVAQTLQALPTRTPYPTPVILPTPTLASLSGLFCEYQFCIGHPNYMAFADANDKTNPSSYGNGKIFAFQQDLVILLTWTQAVGSPDPQTTLQAVMEPSGDTTAGSMNIQQIGDFSVAIMPITPPAQAAASLPFGGIATWVCGDRVFVWKAYTAQGDQAPALLQQALQRFRCEKQ